MEGFLSEEILRQSLLVPKRRHVQPMADEDTLPIQVISQQGPTLRALSSNDQRLDQLWGEYTEAKKRFEEASEAAKVAASEMDTIVDQIRIFTHNRWDTQRETILDTSHSNSPMVPLAPMAPYTVNEEHLDLLTNISIVSKPRFLPRKPRSLLFSRHHPDWMLTSTLDGSIQSWSLDRRAITLPSLHLPSHLNEPCFAEDVCVSQKGGHLAVVLGEPTSAAAGELNTGPGGYNELPTSVRTKLLLIPLAGEEGRLGTPQLLQPDFAVHSKSIASVVSYYDGPSDRSLFLTGGNDRALVLWDCHESTCNVREIHRRHTSSVHTICQQVQSRTVWTGGSDMRLIGYSLSKGQPVFEQRLEHRISHILADQHNPHCLLVAQTKQQEQFRLFDTRTPGMPCPVFGWSESSNTSRYLKPSWHPAGNLIACGSSNPASKSSGINFWDIRYLSRTGNPLQMVEVQPDKRYWSTEFHPTKDLLVALATDGSLSFIDYTLA